MSLRSRTACGSSLRWTRAVRIRIDNVSIWWGIVVLQLLVVTLSLSAQTGSPAVTPSAETAKDATTEAEKTAEFVRAGFRDSMSQLRSGVFHAVGTMEAGTDDHPLEGEIQLFSAFDFDQERFRFDRTEPALLQKQDEADEFRPFTVGGKFISLPDRTIRWILQQDLRAQVERPGPLSDDVVMPFDVRCIGMTGWTALDRGAVWEKCDRVLARPVTDATIVDGHLYRLGWEAEPAEEKRLPIPVRLEITFDSRLGFCPVRYASYMGTDGKGGWLEPQNVTETKWEEVRGVRVPTFLFQERLSRHPPSVARRELTFEWKSVNEPIDGKLFSIEGLDLPEHVEVYDMRSGP